MATVVLLKPKYMTKLLMVIEQATIDYDRKNGGLPQDMTDADAIRKRVNDWVVYHLQDR